MVSPDRSMIKPSAPVAIEFSCVPVFSQVLYRHGANLGRHLLGPSNTSRAMSRVLVEELWGRVFPPLDNKCGEGPLFAAAVPLGASSALVPPLSFSLLDRDGHTTSLRHAPCDSSCEALLASMAERAEVSLRIEEATDVPLGCARLRLQPDGGGADSDEGGAYLSANGAEVLISADLHAWHVAVPSLAIEPHEDDGGLPLCGGTYSIRARVRSRARGFEVSQRLRFHLVRANSDVSATSNASWETELPNVGVVSDVSIVSLRSHLRIQQCAEADNITTTTTITTTTATTWNATRPACASVDCEAWLQSSACPEKSPGSAVSPQPTCCCPTFEDVQVGVTTSVRATRHIVVVTTPPPRHVVLFEPFTVGVKLMTETGAPAHAEQIQALLLDESSVRLAAGTTAFTDEAGNANLTITFVAGASGGYRLFFGSRRTMQAGISQDVGLVVDSMRQARYTCQM